MYYYCISLTSHLYFICHYFLESFNSGSTLFWVFYSGFKFTVFAFVLQSTLQPVYLRQYPAINSCWHFLVSFQLETAFPAGGAALVLQWWPSPRPESSHRVSPMPVLLLDIRKHNTVILGFPLGTAPKSPLSHFTATDYGLGPIAFYSSTFHPTA